MIDFSEFEVVAPVTRRPTKQVVSIFADGTFAINGELKKHIRANKFEVQIKKDFSQILLLPEGKVITDMGKNDRIKNYAVREKFMKKKMKMPVYYIGDWDERANCWVGELIMENPNKTSKKIMK